MGQPIKTITIEGFKSIRKLDAFPLGPLNVLIGANGAGKSNFVEFFRFVRAMSNNVSQRYVVGTGGADRLLHLGPEVTTSLRASFDFANGDLYAFELESTADNRIAFVSETARIGVGQITREAAGNIESRLVSKPRTAGYRPLGLEPTDVARELVSGWTSFDFHHTHQFAPVRREQSARDNDHLWSDGGNVASYLLRLRATDRRVYDAIRYLVCLILPAFDDFRISKASVGTQVIVSTQSASLLNGFDATDVVVVTSREGETEFRRVGGDELDLFLEDFSLGALWETNYIDGASNG